MKPYPPQPVPPVPRRTAAFTLVEMMIAVGVFLGIFVGALVGVQIFGLRVYSLAATKLSATADARKALNRLRDEIRSAKTVYVGNYANGNFSRIANGQPQTGNALEIFGIGTNDMAINATPVIYYQDSSSTPDGVFYVSNGVVNTMANYVTNNDVFTAEDYQATTLTTYDNNPVIRVTMNFYQWEYPIGFIGANAFNAFDFYRLQTRIAPRGKMPYAP